MHKPDLRKLLLYYFDCLEEEDLRGLNFNISQINQSFILGENGSFLLTRKEVQFPAIDSYFWRRHETNSEETERLFIGYPILVHKKTVSPLFFIEMNAKLSKDGFFSLAVADSSCFLNHHLFGKGTYDIEGSLNLGDEFECELSDLQENLSNAFKYLDIHLEENFVLENQEFIDSNGSEPLWARNFILFRGGRSAVNAMLRKDIFTFLKYPKFIENIDGTALEALLTPGLPKELFVDTKAKFFTLNDDQQKAINAGFSQRLTVITGPPGTGKSQVVANILATCALNKRTVLFASKNNKAVDVVYDKLRLMLAGDNWLLRLGNHKKIDECQERIIGQLETSQEIAPSSCELNESLLEVENKLADIKTLRLQLENQQILLTSYEANIRVLESKLNPIWVSQIIEKPSWDKNDDQIKANIDKCYRQLRGPSSRWLSYVWLKLMSLFFSVKVKKYYLNKIETTASLYMEDISDLLSFIRQNNSFSALRDIYEKFYFLLKLKYLYFERDRVENILLRLPAALELKVQENTEIDRQICLYRQKLRVSWSSRIQESRPRLFALCR